jgi:hypothetical protein
MVTKEIKQFVITQMKEADWVFEKYNSGKKYFSKHLTIRHFDDKTEFIMKVPTGYGSIDFPMTRTELNINYFHFLWLLRNVRKSCSLVDKRRRENEISQHWNIFLDKNKDINRDNKINQIID